MHGFLDFLLRVCFAVELVGGLGVRACKRVLIRERRWVHTHAHTHTHTQDVKTERRKKEKKGKTGKVDAIYPRHANSGVCICLGA